MLPTPREVALRCLEEKRYIEVKAADLIEKVIRDRLLDSQHAQTGRIHCPQVGHGDIEMKEAIGRRVAQTCKRSDWHCTYDWREGPVAPVAFFGCEISRMGQFFEYALQK